MSNSFYISKNMTEDEAFNNLWLTYNLHFKKDKACNQALAKRAVKFFQAIVNMYDDPDMDAKISKALQDSKL